MTNETTGAAQAERATFRDELFAAGVLIDGGVDGLYQRSGAFERIVRAIERVASRAGEGIGGPQRYFAPMMAATAFEHTDYLRSFPDLIGTIGVFRGTDADHAALLRAAHACEDWTAFLTPAEVTLCSAACHSLYSTLPRTLPEGGLRYEVQGYCFRHEPSIDPVRMQSFRMHEFVFIGDPDGAVAHRDAWLERGIGILGSLGLDVDAEEANDPFFGRAGRLLAANQRAAALKFEITSPVSTTLSRTAIASANYHESHFGESFGLTTDDGEPAHSSCFGFGLERISLALLKQHGMDPDQWPADVRSILWP